MVVCVCLVKAAVAAMDLHIASRRGPLGFVLEDVASGKNEVAQVVLRLHQKTKPANGPHGFVFGVEAR